MRGFAPENPMPTHKSMALCRRSLLKKSLLSGSALLVDFGSIVWPLPASAQVGDPFAGGTHLGNLDFVNESSVPLDTPEGSELDARLYTDLAALEPQSLVTSTEKFYLRTRASELLPDAAAWQVKIAGLVDR